jgi:DNA-binding NarL/FixJ family response regulator
VSRVLMGGFGPIARAGLRAIFDEAGVEAVHECGADRVMTVVATTTPDLVVLDLDTPGALESAAIMASRHRHLTVIGCSVDSSSMHVYARFGDGRAHRRELTIGGLTAAVRS